MIAVFNRAFGAVPQEMLVTLLFAYPVAHLWAGLPPEAMLEHLFWALSVLVVGLVLWQVGYAIGAGVVKLCAVCALWLGGALAWAFVGLSFTICLPFIIIGGLLYGRAARRPVTPGVYAAFLYFLPQSPIGLALLG